MGLTAINVRYLDNNRDIAKKFLMDILQSI